MLFHEFQIYNETKFINLIMESRVPIANKKRTDMTEQETRKSLADLVISHDQFSNTPDQAGPHPGLMTKTMRGIWEQSNDKERLMYGRDFLFTIRSKVPTLENPVDFYGNAAKGFPYPTKDKTKSRNEQQINRLSRGREQLRLNRESPTPASKTRLMMGNRKGYGPEAGQNKMMPMMVQPLEFPKLHKSENAWKSNVTRRMDDNEKPKDQEIITDDDIVKTTRGILNKITPNNVDKFVGEFINLPFEGKEESLISKVTKMVFENAVDELSFSKEYAKVVHAVCNSSQETSKKFRKLILDQCQQEFQRSSTDEDKIRLVEQQLENAEDGKKDQIKAELEDMKFQMRRRYLGNVRFIGELYKLQMFSPGIMVECVNRLLASADEESLECLCKLLQIIGQKLDEQLHAIGERVNLIKNQPRDSQRMPKFIPDDKWMNKTFNTLRTLSDNLKLSSRIRFALLDIVELKENGWKSRRTYVGTSRFSCLYRQEMEEKKINSLPLAATSKDGSSQQKKGKNNKSNRVLFRM